MFENPAVLAFYHTYNSAGILVSLFCMYIIVTKSSPDMKQYKWALLKVAFWDLMFSIFAGILLFPDVLFPVEGAAILGVVKFFGETCARVTLLLVIFCALNILTSINDCVFVRGLIINGNLRVMSFIFSNKPRAFAISFLTNVCIISPLWVVMVIIFEDPKDFVTRLNGTDDYKYIAHYVDNKAMTISVNKENVWVKVGEALVIIGVVTIYLCNTLTTIRILVKLQKIRAHISGLMYQTHRNMVLMLFLQNMYPVAMIGWVVPYFLYAVETKQEIMVTIETSKHIAAVFLGGYPFVSFLFIVSFVKPYRRYLMSLGRQLIGRNTVASVNMAMKSVSGSLSGIP